MADQLIKQQVDEKTGEVFPAYGFINRDEYRDVQPRDAELILWGIKANESSNSDFHSNCFSRIESGKVKLLISEQDAKSALLATKVGQKMSMEQRIKRLMPHQMTTRLIEEMVNLRLKRDGLKITLQRINSHFPKDKFSAFEYGLWRIKELEDEATKKIRRTSGKKRRLVFYSEGT